jgi:hypothetical protein
MVGGVPWIMWNLLEPPSDQGCAFLSIIPSIYRLSSKL